MLNTIYLYDLKGNFARTLYTGKGPDDYLVREQEMLQDSHLTEHFEATCLRAYPDFFAMMHADSRYC